MYEEEVYGYFYTNDAVEFVDVETEQTEELEHYGTPRHSGRYPWGSGKDPYQHRDDRSIYRQNKNFLNRVNQMKREGIPEADIAKTMGLKNSTDLRAKVSAAKNTNQKIDMDEIKKYRDRGYSTAEIGRRLELAESTIRSLENPKTQANARASENISDQLKNELKTKKYIDVGIGSEAMLGDGGISRDKLDKVLNQLENEGYSIQELKYEQVTNPGQYTTIRVLAPPGTTREEISRNRTEIQTITDSEHADKKVKAFGIEKPVSIDSSRIFVRYDDDEISGGAKDGVIELRRGVDDLYLGDNTVYSQVRVAVDDKYYLKGMAVYSDNVPDGYDIIVNSNKKRGTPMDKVFKKLKKVNENDPDSPVDWDNPFGAAIKDGGQSHYKDPVTGEVKLRAVNKVNEQGDWDEWAKEVSSQWLSKQPLKMINKQLDLSYDIKKAQLDEINTVQNPIVREYLLQEFGRDCDSSAVHLKAAGFPRQGQKVILPVNSLEKGEVYAPSMNDGEYVIGIRHPFQGLWESPLLRVNNRNKEGRSVLGNVQDAIGIRSDTANQMSGADFDGDTITLIPIRGMEKDIAFSPSDDKLPKSILDLRSFDPKKAYAKPEGAEKTGKEKKGKFNKGLEMGKVSNLITDMTIMDAPFEDLAKATKHALVVIDAEKHNLDWKQSMKDNDIEELRKRYQGKITGGSATLISRSKSPVYVPERNQFVFKIDPDTGEIIPNETHRMVTGKDGKKHLKNQEITKMENTKDARKLMSDPEAGYPQEEAYANYANKLKALGNTARKQSIGLKGEYDPKAAETYAKEVASLKAKLNTAIKNKPYEHMAQIEANNTYREKVKGLDANLDKGERKKQASKIRQQALNAARRKYGASRENIEFTEREWDALMSGALKPSTVSQILKNTKSETVKSMAMPHETKQITSGMRSLIMSMDNANYSLADIASRVGVSTSTVSKILRPDSEKED